MLHESDARSRLDSLTPKQRHVLDAISDHKSSKEIARELGISPSTVEQRLNAVRVKLGTRDRGETVRAYRELVSTCEKFPYQFSQVAERTESVDQPAWEHRQTSSRFELRDSGIIAMPAPWVAEPVEHGGLLEVLDGRLGTIGRPVLIFGMAMLLAMTFLLLVSAAQVLQALL